MKPLFLACSLCLCAVYASAHAPFVSPASYWVKGGNTAVLAGFAEKAFDTEVAIRGFEFNVIQPNAEMKALTLTNTKSLSIADIDTQQSGTYQVLGERSGVLKYAKIGTRWLRVLEGSADQLPALAERTFITPAEISDKMQQISVHREDQVITYLSKDHSSPLIKQSAQGLQVHYSQHPNLLSVQQPLTLKLLLNGKVASEYNVVLEKQLNLSTDQSSQIKLKTNQHGEVLLPFSTVGQYQITLTSPDEETTVQPQSQVYRTVISLWVNP